MGTNNSTILRFWSTNNSTIFRNFQPLSWAFLIKIRIVSNLSNNLNKNFINIKFSYCSNSTEMYDIPSIQFSTWERNLNKDQFRFWIPSPSSEIKLQTSLIDSKFLFVRALIKQESTRALKSVHTVNASLWNCCCQAISDVSDD